MVVHRVNEIFGADAILHSADFGADTGIAFHGRAKLGGFGEPGGGYADGGDLHPVHFHLFPVVQIEQGEGLGDVDHLFGKGVFEDGVVYALGDERGIDAKADPFLVGHGIGFHEADRIGEPQHFDFGFQGLAGDDPTVFDVVGDGTELLEEGFGAEKNGKAIPFDLGIIGIQHADGGGDIEPIHRPAGKDIHGSGVHPHGENGCGIVFDEIVVVLFDFSLEGALAVFLYSGRDVAVGGHIDVIGSGFGAGGKDRRVHEAGAGVNRDKNLLFLDERSQGDWVIGVNFDDLEPAIVRLGVKDVGELGLHITQINIAVAIVGMEALTDH